jgi:hypothetical protein
VTLLRCVGSISRPALATRPFDAGPQTPTPEAQMHGETAFALGIWPEAPGEDPGALLRGWERFGLPIAEAPAAGGGSLPRSACLLDLGPEGTDVQLSGVRRRADMIEVRVWNPRTDGTAAALVGGTTVTLGPARIETVTPVG